MKLLLKPSLKLLQFKLILLASAEQPEMEVDDEDIDTEFLKLEPADELTPEEARIMRDELDDASMVLRK